MNSERYLLCRPQGGLNDILVQIELCCRYAEKYDRTVVVDTNYQVVRKALHADLSDYFYSLQPRLKLDSSHLPADLDSMSCFPDKLAGRLCSYIPHHRLYKSEAGDRQIFVDEAGTPLCFDPRCDYKEQVLLHHKGGGGIISPFFLLRVKCQAEIIALLKDRLAKIPSVYYGLHIRNTDYQTDFREQVERLSRSDRSTPIYLATDNANTLEECRQFLGRERVFNFSSTLSKDGTRIHNNLDPGEGRERNIDAILDLFMLVLSQKLKVLALSPNSVGASYSGFSKLAMHLHEHRMILARLFEDETDLLGRYIWRSRER